MFICCLFVVYRGVKPQDTAIDYKMGIAQKWLGQAVI